MRLSLFTDYSLRVLMFGALKDGGPFSLSEVAGAYRISRHHLVKVVNHLAKLGYLETKRGRNGGIGLGMKPEDIRLGLLVRRTENALVIAECYDAKTNTCPISGACLLKGVLGEAVQAFYGTLDRYTLHDIVVGPERKQMQTLLLTAATTR
jgi:Rrf2 family nitric oxide-sensitive transcriptional repressor